MALLPSDALRGATIAISVSESADLQQLGLLEDHFRLAVGELARTVLSLKGRVLYGGHLDPKGYTTFLLSELRRYAADMPRLTVVLAWPVHRAMPLQLLKDAESQLGLHGQLICLNREGNPVDLGANRDAAGAAVAEEDLAPSLTALRGYIVQHAAGHLVIGGKRTGYLGAMPGVIEEVVLALEARRPVFLAGGFGGATIDLVRRLVPNAAEFLTSPELDDFGFLQGLDRAEAAAGGRGWDALANGLDAAENLRLAATHRPSEIASLVSLGLGRLEANSPPEH